MRHRKGTLLQKFCRIVIATFQEMLVSTIACTSATSNKPCAKTFTNTILLVLFIPDKKKPCKCTHVASSKIHIYICCVCVIVCVRPCKYTCRYMLSIYLPIYLSTFQPIHPSIHPGIHPSIYLRESLFRLSGGWLSPGATQLCLTALLTRLENGTWQHKVASPFKLLVLAR